MTKLFSQSLYAASFFLILLFQTGCSLFFGNIKPVEEKSSTYGILDLSVGSSEWVREASTKEGSDTPQTGISDVAYQSKKTASIISLNSACKAYEIDRHESLPSLTRELLLGISDTSEFEEKPITVGDTPALQTTVQGKIDHEQMMLRTVVIQKSKCVYDLMYVSRPEKFKINESDFSRFVSSLKIK